MSEKAQQYGFSKKAKVSSNRLLRVRSNQLFNSVTAKGVSYEDENTVCVYDGIPDINSKIEIGELCVFISSDSCEWKIGKVQKFSKFKCKRLKDQEYKATFAEVKMKDIGVLCIWLVRSKSSLSEYDMDPSSQTQCSKSNDHHVYIPMSNYVCTLNRECFDVIRKSSFEFQEGCKVNITTNYNVAKDKNKIIEAAHIKLTEKCMSYIFGLIKPNENEVRSVYSNSQTCRQGEVICIADENTIDGACGSDTWKTVGNITLKQSDREILLNANGMLSDKHINIGQQMIKQHFPNIGGLNSTLIQQKRIIPLPSNALQVVYLPGHWIAVSTMNVRKEDIVVYDSLSSFNP